MFANLYSRASSKIIKMFLKILFEERKKENRVYKFRGLLAVLSMLTSEHIAENGKVYNSSFVNFDEAIELYYAQP